jgi:arylformamidase
LSYFLHLWIMQAHINYKGKIVSVDLEKPIDISIPLRAGKENVNSFYIPPVKIEPFRMGSFVGSVNEGGSCNVNNIAFNPHGNGTHTECVGHISKENFTINQCLEKFFFFARLISITPEKINGDQVITKDQIISAFEKFPTSNLQFPTSNSELPTSDALIIRTLPNGDDKITKQYSGTNPPYLDHEAAKWMSEHGIEHLLLDVPSVDREDDGGKLSAHHEFWKYPHATRINATITEMIYVPSSIPDGDYFLNIQIASFENDASPSKPVLFTYL